MLWMFYPKQRILSLELPEEFTTVYQALPARHCKDFKTQRNKQSCLNGYKRSYEFTRKLAKVQAVAGLEVNRQSRVRLVLAQLLLQVLPHMAMTNHQKMMIGLGRRLPGMTR